VAVPPDVSVVEASEEEADGGAVGAALCLWDFPKAREEDSRTASDADTIVRDFSFILLSSVSG
jgi:hypothetical protein